MGGFGSPGGGRGRGGKGRGRGGGKGGRGRGGGKGKGRGKGGKGKGKGKGGAKGGAKVVVEPHRHEGVFIARGKEDVIVTLNSTPGKDVYGEKRISVDGPANEDGTTTKIEYRVWNPFRSKLCAAILGGVDTIHMKPGSKVLYLGGAAGTTVSHVSDLVGPQGCVYAVEFSHRPGRDLINMAKHRTNVIPIIEVRSRRFMKVPSLPYDSSRGMMDVGSFSRPFGRDLTETPRAGRAPPPEVPHARGHGRLRLRGRRPAGPGSDRGAELAVLPQGGGRVRRQHQGLVH